MIELAPRHKYGLPLPGPVMPAAGVLGYGDIYRDLVDVARLGALVTTPVSWRPRHAARGERVAARGEHVVLHTGLPNPGLRAVIREYGRLWDRYPIPVIVHLLATTVAETARAAARLSTVAGVLGVELGLAEDALPEDALDLVAAASAEGDLPVIARVPFSRAAALIPHLREAGADALTLTAPPRAVLPLDDVPDADALPVLVRGRLYGPAVFPLMLGVLGRWAREADLPIIARGGIAAAADARACLALGAVAVQVDAAVWRDPGVLEAIAAGLDDRIE